MFNPTSWVWMILFPFVSLAMAIWVLNQNLGFRTRWRLFAFFAFPMWMPAIAFIGIDPAWGLYLFLDYYGVV